MKPPPHPRMMRPCLTCTIYLLLWRTSTPSVVAEFPPPFPGQMKCWIFIRILTKPLPLNTSYWTTWGAGSRSGTCGKKRVYAMKQGTSEVWICCRICLKGTWKNKLLHCCGIVCFMPHRKEWTTGLWWIMNISPALGRLTVKGVRVHHHHSVKSAEIILRWDYKPRPRMRTHAEHLAHTLNPVPPFERVGHCVPVGTDDKI